MIRCADGSLYTGMSTDPKRRFAEHERGGPRAARYLKGRQPLELVFTCPAGERAEAMKLERKIKSLPRLKKLELINKAGMLPAGGGR
ncbi:MAG: GIY-YIG nuclease family protein [Syntrophales bacterium]|nr:GIY-YIG nuclease family protein [Syntrophales bacterium]